MSVALLAQRIAFKAHDGQFRRDGVTPYYRHPQAVVRRLENESEEVQAVAWLHDVIEDTPTNGDMLRSMGVPDSVVAAVEVLTKRDGVKYEDYLEGVAACEIARKVKVADMLCNLADSPTPKQILKYAKGLEALMRERDAISHMPATPR